MDTTVSWSTAGITWTLQSAEAHQETGITWTLQSAEVHQETYYVDATVSRSTP